MTHGVTCQQCDERGDGVVVCGRAPKIQCTTHNLLAFLYTPNLGSDKLYKVHGVDRFRLCFYNPYFAVTTPQNRNNNNT